MIASKNIIEVSHLIKFFGHRKVVDDVSFGVKKGSFFALLGSNGAGKTTILNIILLFLKANSGSVIFNGKSYVDTYQSTNFFKSQIGVVFQSSVLDQELTIIQNLEFAASLYNLSNQEQKKRIQEIIELLNIDHNLLNKKISTLSGGERRKVDIARAIINNPKILFLDELTASLDPEAQRIVWKFVEKLNKEYGVTVIFTTHYLEETEKSDEVLILHKGKVIEHDSVINLKNKYHLNYIMNYGPKDEKLEILLLKKRIKFDYQKDCYYIYFKDEKELNLYLNELNEFLKNFKIVNGSMRDVFLHAVGVEI